MGIHKLKLSMFDHMWQPQVGKCQRNSEISTSPSGQAS